MAVIKGVFTDDRGEVTLTNGDLQALKKIAAEYGIEDETDVITFALGVLSQAKGKAISIDQEHGSVIKFVPSEKIRRSND